MSEWEAVALGDCCEIVSGATPNTSRREFWNGNICWATPKDLSELNGTYISNTPRKLTRVGLDNCSATILPPDSVLFSSRAPIGHVAINTVPMATNQGFKSFVPDRARVDARFLFRWLRYKRPYLESLGNGATFKEVSKAVVSRIEIRLPPLPEQRRIAAILDRADELRTKRRAALEQLNGLRQAIFSEMFGDPHDSEHPWSIVPLGDICRRVVDGTHKTPTYTDSGVPFVTVKNIATGELIFEGAKFIAAEEHALLTKRVKPEVGDILVSKDGTIGIACPVRTDTAFSMFVSVALLKVKHDIVDPLFLTEQFRTGWVQAQIRAGTKGIAIRHLHLEDFKKLNMVLPPLAMQRELVKRVARVERVKKSHSASLAELTALFSSLQNRAFAGAL